MTKRPVCIFDTDAPVLALGRVLKLGREVFLILSYKQRG